MQAKVTDILTTAFAEVALLDANGEPEKRKRHIAEDTAARRKDRAKRGDIVELEPVDNRIVKIARIAYIMPVILLVLGMVLPKSYTMQERVITGVVLGVMGFVIAWLMNRRARLLQRKEYDIVDVVKRAKEL